MTNFPGDPAEIIEFFNGTLRVRHIYFKRLDINLVFL